MKIALDYLRNELKKSEQDLEDKEYWHAVRVKELFRKEWSVAAKLQEIVATEKRKKDLEDEIRVLEALDSF